MFKREEIIFKTSFNAIKAFHFIDGYYLGELVLSEDVEFNRYKHLCNGDKLLKIVRIETARGFTNCGVATALLEELFRRLPQYNFYILCHPMPRGECDEMHKTVGDLKHFYSKFGFVPCMELLPTMIRKA